MNSLSSTDKPAFVIVITVTNSSINFDLQFEEKIDEEITALVSEEVRKMEEEYLQRPIDSVLKMEIENRLWKFIRNNNLDCLATKWK